MYYVSNRWLRNVTISTIKSRAARLNKIEEMEQNGDMELLKKEVIQLMHEKREATERTSAHP